MGRGPSRTQENRHRQRHTNQRQRGQEGMQNTPRDIGKMESPSCPCGHPILDGDHITFSCPIWAYTRSCLAQNMKTSTDQDGLRKERTSSPGWRTPLAWYTPSSSPPPPPTTTKPNNGPITFHRAGNTDREEPYAATKEFLSNVSGLV